MWCDLLLDVIFFLGCRKNFHRNSYLSLKDSPWYMFARMNTKMHIHYWYFLGPITNWAFLYDCINISFHVLLNNTCNHMIYFDGLIMINKYTTFFFLFLFISFLSSSSKNNFIYYCLINMPSKKGKWPWIMIIYLW